CLDLKVQLTYRSVSLPRVPQIGSLLRKWTSQSSKSHMTLTSLSSRRAFGQTPAERCQCVGAGIARHRTSSRPRCVPALAPPVISASSASYSQVCRVPSWKTSARAVRVYAEIPGSRQIRFVLYHNQLCSAGIDFVGRKRRRLPAATPLA